MALQLQTEELNRSRADYTALFQNFKQSRIIFEERELAGKSNSQKIIGENKVLDGILKEVTAELKLCRSEFIDLQKNFEYSSTAAEEQNQTNRAQIQRLTDQYEIAKYKIRAQKTVIKEQRATQRDFEADLQKIEQSTNLFKIRDEAITDKYDTIAAMNIDLREELKAKSSIVMRQAADVVRLNSLIADEMISKYDYKHILSENEELKRKISEETVSIETYLTSKEKYASLLSYIEQRMVSTDERGVVSNECQQSDSKQNEDHTTLTIEADLQENLQKSIDERCGVINTVQALQDAKSCILRELSESEERYISVHVLLEEARAEISAYKVTEELRIQMNSSRDDALDKNLIAQRTTLSVNDVKKEKKIVDDLEKLLRSLKKELQDEKNFRSSQLEQSAIEHSSEIIELRKIMRIEMEEEKTLIGKDLLMIHGIEVQGLHDGYNLQLSFLSTKLDEARSANEVLIAREKSLVDNKPDKNLVPPRVQNPSNLTVGNHVEIEDSHNNDNDIIRLMTDKYRNNTPILEGKNNVLKSEITALKDTLKESLKGLKFERNRADLLSSDLIRIELEYKNAILCIEEAQNKEIFLNEQLNMNDMKYKQCVDEMESKIKENEELYKNIEGENEQVFCDNEILKEIASNLEMECSNLKGQLEDVKNAVLESMTITIPRNQQVHSSSLSSLDFLNHRNPSNAPTARTRNSSAAVTATTATTVAASTAAFQSNLNGNNGKKLKKSATRIPRPKIPNEKVFKTQDHFITPIQAALNRKQAFATAAAAIENALAMQPVHQHVKQKQRDTLKVPIPKQQQKTIRTKKKPSSHDKGPVDTVNNGVDEHTDLTPTISCSMDFINTNTNTSCLPGQLVDGSDPPILLQPLWSPLGDQEGAGHRVRVHACSAYPLGESVGAVAAEAEPLPVTVDDPGAGAGTGWMDRISLLLSFQSDSFQHESDLLPYTLPLPVPVLVADIGAGGGGGTGGGGDAEVRVGAAFNGGYSTVYHPVGPVNSDNGSPRHARTLETVHPILSTSLSQPPLPYNTDKVSVLRPLTVSPSSLELMDRLIQSSRVQGPFSSSNIPSE